MCVEWDMGEVISKYIKPAAQVFENSKRCTGNCQMLKEYVHTINLKRGNMGNNEKSI